MEVRLSPELEKKLSDLAVEVGRPAEDLVQDAIAGWVDETAGLRALLTSRYEDITSGRVQPIDGEDFFENLRRREVELIQSRGAE